MGRQHPIPEGFVCHLSLCLCYGNWVRLRTRRDLEVGMGVNSALEAKCVVRLLQTVEGWCWLEIRNLAGRGVWVGCGEVGGKRVWAAASGRGDVGLGCVFTLGPCLAQKTSILGADMVKVQKNA